MCVSASPGRVGARRLVWLAILPVILHLPPRCYSTSPTPVSAISQISRGCQDVALRVGALRSNLRREYSMIFFGAAQGSFIVLSVFIIAFSQGSQPDNPGVPSFFFHFALLALHSVRAAQFSIPAVAILRWHERRQIAVVAETAACCAVMRDHCVRLRLNQNMYYY